MDTKAWESFTFKLFLLVFLPAITYYFQKDLDYFLYTCDMFGYYIWVIELVFIKPTDRDFDTKILKVWRLWKQFRDYILVCVFIFLASWITNPVLGLNQWHLNEEQTQDIFFHLMKLASLGLMGVLFGTWLVKDEKIMSMLFVCGGFMRTNFAYMTQRKIYDVKAKRYELSQANWVIFQQIFNGSQGNVVIGVYYALAKGTICVENLAVRIVCSWIAMFSFILIIQTKHDTVLDEYLSSCSLEPNTIKFLMWYVFTLISYFNEDLTKAIFSHSLTDHVNDFTERDYSKGRSKSCFSASKSQDNISQTMTGDKSPKKSFNLKRVSSKRELKKKINSTDNIERLIKSTKTKNTTPHSSETLSRKLAYER